jgi:FkbM family methyltransferase
MASPTAVHPDDRPFHHYSRKHRLIAWVSQTFFDQVTYKVPAGLLAGLKRKGGLGFLSRQQELTREQRFLLSLNFAGKVVYDIGAFHGLMTLFFARSAKQVIAWEPNERNRRRVAENLAINHFTNATVRPYGLSSFNGTSQLIFDPLIPGGGKVDPSGRPASMESMKVDLRRLDDEIASGLPEPDFLKIDVEGRELDVLEGAPELLKRGPELFLEMHGDTMREKREKTAAIVRLLTEAGYEIKHVESGQTITPANSDAACRGHLFCPARAASFRAAGGKLEG